MLTASTEYIAYESQPRGATPAVRVSFLPYLWPNGVNADGTFNECSFISPDRIQADYHGFTGGYWISPALSVNLQIPTTPAVITWTWNFPGYTGLLYYRAADDVTALAAAAWTLANQGDTVQIYSFYQIKLTLDGYRAWAEDALGDADNFTAWAVDTVSDAYASYAADVNISGDPLAYIETIELVGQYTIVRDIQQAGSLSMEAPKDFSDLVAGQHSGLILNNRQGAFDALLAWTPAPEYSPNKSSFFLAGQDWYDIQLRIELGWLKGGWFASEFLETEWFTENYTDFITLFLGRVKKWGPVTREVESPNEVEVYAVDWIMDCFEKRICLPAADGTPAPLTFGEFLCKAEAVSGWSPAPVVDAEEADHVAGGGTIDIITPGIVGDTAFRCTTTGASQSAYRSIRRMSSGEMFVSGIMRFNSVPANPTSFATHFMSWYDAAGTPIQVFGVYNTGLIYSNLGGELKFNILGYLDVPLSFAAWIKPGANGFTKLWINGDEILNLAYDMSPFNPIELQLGIVTGAVAESWEIDFDENIELRHKYYDNAFQVTGGPFASLGPVYIDNVAQPDTITGTYTQTLTRYPDWGLVQFVSTDPEFTVNGEVTIRVIENSGGRHALYILEQLLAAAGVTEYIDAASLAAAYAACPDDIINARFEGGGDRGKTFGLPDKASLGITIAEAIKEITSRMLYWFFVDAGQIKIIPYTGIHPTSPALALTASNLREATQVIDLEGINAFVSAIYGWYDRNPSLFYLAGVQEVGGNGTSLDYTWSAPVACESRSVIKSKVDLLLKFLSACEYIDPARVSLIGARLELMEAVSLNDALLNDATTNYWVTSKEVGLDAGSRETTLQLTRFLGDT